MKWRSASCVSSVALDASIQSSFIAWSVVLSTARPENKNFPHTFWILLFNFSLSGFDVSSWAYCTFFPYSGQSYFVGPCTGFLGASCNNCFNALFT